MAAYRLTPKARDSLRDILAYVDRRFGARVAGEVLERLVAAFETLAANPGVGHRRDDLTGDERIRFWSVGPTLMAYRVGALGGIEILLIERGERDWKRIAGDSGI